MKPSEQVRSYASTFRWGDFYLERGVNALSSQDLMILQTVRYEILRFVSAMESRWMGETNRERWLRQAELNETYSGLVNLNFELVNQIMQTRRESAIRKRMEDAALPDYTESGTRDASTWNAYPKRFSRRHLSRMKTARSPEVYG